MPLLPGLTSFSEDAPDASGRIGSPRVQVNPNALAAPDLHPSAAPVNTYNRPQDDGLGRLAEGLSWFSSSLQHFGEAREANLRSTAPDRIAQVAAPHVGDPEGMREALRTNPDVQDEMAQRHGMALVGQQRADIGADDLKADYETNFDKLNGNFDDFLKAHVQKALGPNPTPAESAGFMTRMGPAVNALRQQYTKDRVEAVQKQQSDQIYGSFNATLNASIDANATPEQALGAIRKTMETNSFFSNKTPDEQNALLVQNLQRRLDGMKDAKFEDVEKTYNLITGVLTTPTVDPKTGQVKALKDDTAVGALANQVLAHATEEFAKREEIARQGAKADIHELARTASPGFKDALQKFNEAHPRWTTPGWTENMTYAWEEAQRKSRIDLAKRQAQVAEDNQKNAVISDNVMPALASGEGHALVDRPYMAKDGTQATYTVKDQLEDGVKTAQRQIDEKFAGNPQAKFQAETQLYGENPVKNKQWETLLKSAPGAASVAVQAGQSLPPSLAKGYELYKQMAAASPGLVAKHTDEKSQAFFEIAKIAESTGYAPDAPSALALAARATANPTTANDTAGTARKDVQLAVTQALRGGLFGTNLSGAGNGSGPVNEATELALVLHRATGMNSDVAAQEAVKVVQNNYVKINGNAVRIAGKDVPKNFGDLASQYVDAFYENNREKLQAEGIGKGDLTIQNIAGGLNWQIFGTNGMMLPFSMKGRAFTPQALAQIQYGNTLAADAAARDKLEHRYDPLLTIGNPDNGGLTVGPLFTQGATPAQERLVKEEARKKYQEQQDKSSQSEVALEKTLGKEADRLATAQTRKGAMTFTKSSQDIGTPNFPPLVDGDRPLLEAWDKNQGN